jgi:4a-hydroxytetrahydrobiopterin dehydratase
MATQTATDLAHKKCQPCSGGTAPYSLQQAQEQLTNLPDWRLTQEGKRIRRDWVVKDFLAGLEFFEAIGQVAEAEDHHPDLHLEGYRNVWVELWTHAIGGLSENDFIMAAKIDRLPVKLKKT